MSSQTSGVDVVSDVGSSATLAPRPDRKHKGRRKTRRSRHPEPSIWSWFQGTSVKGSRDSSDSQTRYRRSASGTSGSGGHSVHIANHEMALNLGRKAQTGHHKHFSKRTNTLHETTFMAQRGSQDLQGDVESIVSWHLRHQTRGRKKEISYRATRFAHSGRNPEVRGHHASAHNPRTERPEEESDASTIHPSSDPLEEGSQRQQPRSAADMEAPIALAQSVIRWQGSVERQPDGTQEAHDTEEEVESESSGSEEQSRASLTSGPTAQHEVSEASTDLYGSNPPSPTHEPLQRTQRANGQTMHRERSDSLLRALSHAVTVKDDQRTRRWLRHLHRHDTIRAVGAGLWRLHRVLKKVTISPAAA